MHFSIITPTYKRPAELARAVASVVNQSVASWEMIIVNDNPGDSAADPIAEYSDLRIKILENHKNEGVNYSRNRGLDAISSESEYVIFLDDDDTLTPDALSQLEQLANATKSLWIVTARGTGTNTATTITPANKHHFSYPWDYLIRRRFKGDATHCIATVLVNNSAHPMRFPTHIKQAEEWLFYSELATRTHFYYEPIVTTLTSGYAASGLNYRRRTMIEQLQLIPTIVREARGRDLYITVSFWVYVKMRVIRAFLR